MPYPKMVMVSNPKMIILSKTNPTPSSISSASSTRQNTAPCTPVIIRINNHHLVGHLLVGYCQERLRLSVGVERIVLVVLLLVVVATSEVVVASEVVLWLLEGAGACVSELLHFDVRAGVVVGRLLGLGGGGSCHAELGVIVVLWMICYTATH